MPHCTNIRAQTIHELRRNVCIIAFESANSTRWDVPHLQAVEMNAISGFEEQVEPRQGEQRNDADVYLRMARCSMIHIRVSHV